MNFKEHYCVPLISIIIAVAFLNWEHLCIQEKEKEELEKIKNDELKASERRNEVRN